MYTGFLSSYYLEGFRILFNHYVQYEEYYLKILLIQLSRKVRDLPTYRVYLRTHKRQLVACVPNYLSQNIQLQDNIVIRRKLKALSDKDHTISDIFDFAEDLHDIMSIITVSLFHTMYHLLFKNVPVDETIQILAEKVF